MSAISFTSHRPDSRSRARVGMLSTPHGTIDTPAFIVGATQATVRSLLPPEVAALGAQALFCPSYHLNMRPGPDLIAELGGLHAFIGWSGPIFTDNGGYPVFSLGFGPERGNGKVSGQLLRDDPREGRRSEARALPALKPPKVDDDGVTFRSHLDGSTHRLTAASTVRMQEQLGGDIIQALAQPTSAANDERATVQALTRTHRWAERALTARQRTDQGLYGVVAGGLFRQLREASAAFVGGLPFDGYAIGGTLGTTRRQLEHVLDWSVPALPEDRPRHLSGIGEPADLFLSVERGIDTFDSAVPTRHASRGVLLTAEGPLTISKLIYREDDGPIDAECGCPTCTTFTRAYLRHLFAADELLAYTLAATHNLAFVLGLMAQIRAALTAGSLESLKAAVLGRYGRKPAATAAP